METENAARAAGEQLKNAIARGRSAEHQHGTVIDALHEVHPVFPGKNGSLEDFERYTSAAQFLIVRVTTAIERVEGLAQLRELVSTASPVSQVADWSEKLQKQQRTHETRHSVDDAKHSEEKVQRIVGRLTGAATGSERQALQTLARELLGAKSSSRADSLEAELRLQVQRINDRIQKAQSERAEAAGLFAELVGLHGNDVEAIRQEVQAVLDGQSSWTPNLAERVGLVRKHAEKRMDDAYVGLVLREELEKLGYALGEDFSTLFVNGGQVIASRPEQREYGVKIAVDASHGIMDMEVVRFADAEKVAASERQLRDAHAEEAWCSDHDGWLAAMRSRGIKGRTLKRTPPGSHAVPVTEASRQHRSRRVGGSVPTQRELREDGRHGSTGGFGYGASR